jgi:hypothetical protein
MGLRRQHGRYTQVKACCDLLGLRQALAVITNQHRTKLSCVGASAAVLYYPAKRHFGEVAPDGILQKHWGGRRNGRGCTKKGGSEQGFAKHGAISDWGTVEQPTAACPVPPVA